MHHLCPRSRRHPSLSRGFTACQALVRFFALHRIKPHAPPLVRAPVNSFEFHSCERTPQAGYLTQLADAYSSDTVIASSPRKEVHDPWAFYLHAALLRQAFAHCGKFPTAASRRSLGRVSVPVWLIIFSDQLLIIALHALFETGRRRTDSVLVEAEPSQDDMNHPFFLRQGSYYHFRRNWSYFSFPFPFQSSYKYMSYRDRDRICNLLSSCLAGKDGPPWKD
ncbi:hypothetical protein IEQ34_026266 [Dendrobium chrysotoxum]|uniref:Uncharacterized protein n=1 Tax=Dendrobium chrysotoxum TaxID=161865 RepID=A0AAV7FMT3_DENCH|nr:hypothetical protein IEQ34_026266 [Dendrobium chrysotoxum]